MATVLGEMGHSIFYCAGELDGTAPGLEAPELHFKDPVARSLGDRAFGRHEPDPDLEAAIDRRAQALKRPLRAFLDSFAVEYLIVENAFAIPMQLPLAQAVAELLAERKLPALAHNHDFYWERTRFFPNNIGTFLDTYFPPAIPNLHQATINSLAQEALRERRGLQSVVIPNVFDYDTPPPGIDDYNLDFRAKIGLTADDWLLLQPTRVVPRKGIELAIELVARLDDPRAHLVITHEAGDEGVGYLRQLQELAVARDVRLHYVAGIVSDVRSRTPAGEKIYSLWDAYPHADAVTYPSLVEGFGNALLETVYFKKPALVNRYDVYVADIAPLGFRFAEIAGTVTASAVRHVRGWLENPASAAHLVAHNYRLAQAHFSYTILQAILRRLLPE